MSRFAFVLAITLISPPAPQHEPIDAPHVLAFLNRTIAWDERLDGVFGEYGAAIERQHRDMERLLNTSTTPPLPHSRLRVAPTGVEIRVRYPVEIENAGDVDDRIAAAVTEATKP